MDTSHSTAVCSLLQAGSNPLFLNAATATSIYHLKAHWFIKELYNLLLVFILLKIKLNAPFYGSILFTMQAAAGWLAQFHAKKSCAGGNILPPACRKKKIHFVIYLENWKSMLALQAGAQL